MTALADQMARAIRAHAKGVVLIAFGSADGKRFVMPATAVTAVSMTPPSLLICVSRSASSYPTLALGVNFSVSILKVEQMALAQHCATARTHEERFAMGDWRLAGDGTPFLGDAAASFVCRQDQRVSSGTHDVIIGGVTSIVEGDIDSPLVYADGAYHALGERLA